MAHRVPPLPGRIAKSNNFVKSKPFISSSEIKRSMQELISVTTRTIRNRMHKGFKLPARKPLKKPLITPRMAQQKLEFCCHYKDWTKEDWQKVMSFDESTFLQFASYKPFVRRPHGSSPADSQYLQPTVKQPPIGHGVGVLFQPRPRWSLFLAKRTNNECLTKY